MSKICKTFSVIVAVIFVLGTSVHARPNKKITKIQKAHQKTQKVHKAHKVHKTHKKAREPSFHPNTSISAIDITTGKVLIEHQPDLSLKPASCAKIVTAAAALHMLGPDYHFATYFYTDSPIKSGAIGNLYIAGTGDPFFVSEAVDNIAKHLAKYGVRKVSGNIVIDNSYFDSYYFPRKDGNNSRAYTAKTSPTAVNFNSVTIVATPGTRVGSPALVSTNPPTDYFKIVNKVRTGKGTSIGITSKEDGSQEVITVSGSVSIKSDGEEYYRNVANPALASGSIIKYFLEENGITVNGTVKEGRVPKNVSLLLADQSLPVSELVKAMNKKSNNFMAEQIIKHLGAVKAGLPGTTQNGIKVIENYLSSIGIPKATYVIENGSGLSDVTHMSANQLVKILAWSYKNKTIKEAFRDSLSILGVDGTTKKWHFEPDLIGKVLVKTGTINGVSTLAGYAPLPNGHTAAFAILMNDTNNMGLAHKSQLDLVKSLMESGSSGAVK